MNLRQAAIKRRCLMMGSLDIRTWTGGAEGRDSLLSGFVESADMGEHGRGD